jgi:hypothetical protein
MLPALSKPHEPILTAATLVAVIGAATTSASAQREIASETARGVINRIILGGKVGPDFYTFVSANKGDGQRTGSNHGPQKTRICSVADPQRGASMRLNYAGDAASAE